MAEILERPQADLDEACLPETASRLAEENSKLARENEKLAEEVLRCYEQINFVFDVSAQVAVLTDAAEVRQLLMIKLRHMFDAEAVYYLSPDRSMLKHLGQDEQVQRLWASGSDSPSAAGGLARTFGRELPAEFETALRRLEKKRGVFVFVDGADWTTGHGTSMWGPLRDADDDGFAAVGLIRRRRPFVSADMLLFDSILTYASHILGNLLLVEKLKRTSFEAVRALVNAIDQKDPYTAGHSERVGFLAKITGEHMGLPAAQVQDLEWAGLLHDVGKIGIPEDVLNKPGKLTAEEFAIIKGHPSRSYEVLRPVAKLEGVLDGVLYHHENPDGSGYPKGLKGDQIPLAARIIHVVDVFDALTSTRSYREAFPFERAVSILRKDAGTRLDARIVEEFLAAWQLLRKTHPEEYTRWFGGVKESYA